VGILNNYFYLAIQAIIIIGQICIVQFGGVAVRVQPLSLGQHLCCFAIGFVCIPIGFLTKALPYETDDGSDTDDVRSKKNAVKSSSLFLRQHSTGGKDSKKKN